MVPMIAATVTATAVAFYVDGYSIYSARFPSQPPGRRPGSAAGQPADRRPPRPAAEPGDRGDTHA